MVTIEVVEHDDNSSDRTDRAAASTAARHPDTDIFDVAVALRIIRTAQLLTRSWRTNADDTIEQPAQRADFATIAATRGALRYTSDLDRQDLVDLLRKITVALGDLPGTSAGADRSDLPNNPPPPKPPDKEQP